MTLDEAIKHCEEVADYDCYGEKQIQCAAEHQQLAEWLRDLKNRRMHEGKPPTQPLLEHSAWFRISEALVDESKGDITAEQAIVKIRGYMRRMKKPEIIRCGECVNFKPFDGLVETCALHGGKIWRDLDYCSHAERKAGV